ncbi:MAG: hypothetical protein KAW09_02925, partial [Thermoplasmata archaeon]|nr:hypothetical protein [Thermoplasmata archaeon]
QVRGSASDPDGDHELVKVEVKVNDESWEVATGTTDWSYYLNTRLLSDGNHAIAARSFDGLDHSDEVSVTVKVDNNEPPVVTVISVSHDQILRGEVNLVGIADDPDGNEEIVQVEVRIDNGNWQNATGTSSWNYLLDTVSLDNGNHTLYFRAYDGTEHSITIEVPVAVDNEDGTESGWITSFLVWIGVAIAILVSLIASYLVFLRRRRRAESPDAHDETEPTDESPDSTSEEELK